MPWRARTRCAASSCAVSAGVACSAPVKKGIPYSRCQPDLNNRGTVAERLPDLPTVIHVREDLLLRAVADFFLVAHLRTAPS